MKLENYLQEHMTQRELAAILGVTQGAISQWIVKGSIPPTRVLQIETATRGMVKRHEMRPDIYPT